MGEAFQGVPLGDYNFGGTIGVQNVGDTDTIIQRLATATGPTAATINTKMVALQLESTAPINLFGAGVGMYFITLQSVRGGTASTGTMTINFGSGNQTFTSSLDVFFDIRKGSLTGQIVDSSDMMLSSSGNAWNNVAPPGSVLINGVNNNLNGADTSNDFWPAVITQQNPIPFQQIAADATVPDGGLTAGMLAASLLCLGALHSKFSRKLDRSLV